MRVVTVIGVGNPLLGDEGVGPRAVQLLEPFVPDDVRTLTSDRIGCETLADVVTASRLLVIEAHDGGLPAGAIVRLDRDDIVTSQAPHLSPHELDLCDVLLIAALRGAAPDEVVLLRVQPLTAGAGDELSEPVRTALPMLVAQAMRVIGSWVPGLAAVAG
jgi:hydrogenase maturation protease